VPDTVIAEAEHALRGLAESLPAEEEEAKDATEAAPLQ